MKKFGLPTVFLVILEEKNVNKSDRDVRERDERVREQFS